MNLRGRVNKLERPSCSVERKIGTNEDARLWTWRFRAADPENQRIIEDICAYTLANHTANCYHGECDQVHASQCFKVIYFPIVHAVNKGWESRHANFARSPELLRRLVTALWKYQRTCREPFPLDYHWVDFLAGPDGKGMCKLWCLYADLADLWVTDRNHPRVLAWRKYREEHGLDR